MRLRRLAVPALSAALAAAALPACGAEEPAKGDASRGKEIRIDLEVVEGRGGSTLALVPVYVGGEGPLPFALDTGASQSVIDRQVAERVGLRSKGGTTAQGVGGNARGIEVAVRDWRAGDTKLPPQQVTSIDLPEDRRGDGLQGLLGSDVLNAYDVITVDYDEEVLILRPRAR